METSPAFGANRFEAKVPTRVVLQLVREVAIAGDRRSPQTITRDRWNAARSRTRWRMAPSGSALCKRFEVRWRALVEAAFRPSDVEASRLLALQNRRPQMERLSLEHAADALRRVAREVRVDSLRPDAYDACRDRLVAAAARKRRRGARLDWFLPTAAAIEFAVGWDSALEAAGLQPRDWASRSRPPVPRAVAVAWFIERHGDRPNVMSLRAFAGAHGFSMAGWAREHAVEVRAGERMINHGNVPPMVLGDWQWAAPRTRDWDDYVELVAEALTELGPRDARVTQRAWRQLAARRPGTPAYATLDRIARRHGRRPVDLFAEAAARAQARG